MSKLNTKGIMPFAGLMIFIISFIFLSREIKQYSLEEIIKHIVSVNPWIVILALVFVGLNHLFLTFYDYLAFKYIGRELGYKKVALTSFISFVFGNNIGFSGFSSSAVRFRMYNSWKVPVSDVLQIILFCLFSFWIGLISTAGIIFLIIPIFETKLPIFSALSPQLLGVIFLVITLVYLGFTHFYKKAVVIKGKSFMLPSLKISLLQIVVSVADWVLAGAVLYILLPNFLQIQFLEFLSVFMLALIAGFLSNVPGGLGVFETIIIAALSKYYTADILIGAIFVYRVVYYIIPLIAATTAYTIFELLHIKELIRGIVKFLVEMTTNIVPSLIAICLFLGGLMLFFDDAGKNVVQTSVFGIFIPFYIVQLSHFISSMAGLLMAVSAFGIRKRLREAYDFSLIFIIVGVVFSMLKGIRGEEAILLIILSGSLLLSKNLFPAEKREIGKEILVIAVFGGIFAVISSVWITVFSHSDIEVLKIFAWQFDVGEGTPFVLKATIVIAVLVLSISAARIIKPFKQKLLIVSEDDLKDVREIIKYSENAYSNLAFLGDKQFFINKNHKNFIMYGVIGKSCITYGDPVGNQSTVKETIHEFYDICRKNEYVPAFYQINGCNIPIYLDMGMAVIKIGEEAKVNLADFNLEGKSKSKMRYTMNKFEKNGFSFEILDNNNLDEIIEQLRSVSEKWLERKNVREKKFSLGYFNEEYLKNFPIAVIKKEDKILAFANIFTTETKEEICVDMMRYIPGEIDHVMEFLFLNLMLWGKEKGFKKFNLGMAPFSGFHDSRFTSLWNRAGYLLFNHGEKIYNFRGLKSFKDQFSPSWESKYIALPGGVGMPKLLLNIGTLISGGATGMIKK